MTAEPKFVTDNNLAAILNNTRPIPIVYHTATPIVDLFWYESGLLFIGSLLGLYLTHNYVRQTNWYNFLQSVSLCGTVLGIVGCLFSTTLEHL